MIDKRKPLDCVDKVEAADLPVALAVVPEPVAVLLLPPFEPVMTAAFVALEDAPMAVLEAGVVVAIAI